MYVTLFNVAGFAIVAWLLLIFLPKWSVTRWLAKSALFPVLLCALYLVGVVPLLMGQGLGVVRDFGSAEGVTRLLARQDVALVAWIHILAFDQLVGLFIYRDNMEHRYVPLPVQSVLLFLTLMFGPVGFLAYYLLKLARRGRAAEKSESAAEAAQTSRSEAEYVEPLKLEDSSAGAVRAAVASLLTEERALFVTGAAGFVLGAIGFALMLARGRFVPPEGDLYKMASFDIAIGIYVLTVLLYLPLTGMSARGRRRLRWWWVGLTVYAYATENVQIYRGIDPRFTRAGTAADEIAGALLGLSALGLIAVFVFVAQRFFFRRTRIDGTLLLLGVRYAVAATLFAFATGFWMGAVQGSRVGSTGSLLPLHALGFHGLQAVPLVALLLMWSRANTTAARRWVHAAGLSWLAACAFVAWQTAQGRAVYEPSPATLLASAMLLVWLACAVKAVTTWSRATHDKPRERAHATA